MFDVFLAVSLYNCPVALAVNIAADTVWLNIWAANFTLIFLNVFRLVCLLISIALLLYLMFCQCRSFFFVTIYQILFLLIKISRLVFIKLFRKLFIK